MRKIQDYPSVDSAPTEPFEAVVEAYYQINGYITSANKWFWWWGGSKQQRGYQDIDLLAINGKESHIVCVANNFDDKISLSRKGQILNDTKLRQYFGRARGFLGSVKEYAWLVKKARRVHEVFAFASGNPNSVGMAKQILEDKGIDLELLAGENIITSLKERISERQARPGSSVKTNNLIVKTIQLILRQEENSKKSHRE